MSKKDKQRAQEVPAPQPEQLQQAQSQPTLVVEFAGWYQELVNCMALTMERCKAAGAPEQMLRQIVDGVLRQTVQAAVTVRQ